MKAIILTTLFVFLLSFNNGLQAENIKYKVLTNIEETENGSVKECVFLDKETLSPQTKSVYIYDIDKKLLEKTHLVWKGLKGWIETQRYVYNYSKTNDLLGMTYFENDRKPVYVLSNQSDLAIAQSNEQD